MRLKKRIAKVLAVFMIATSVPVFAASTNGVDKVVTVKEGATIEAALAPELKIELKDDLAKGQQFYLSLENAEWDTDVVADLGTNANFKFIRESKTSLLVEAKKILPASTTAYRIPLIATITGGGAKVEIISNETVVTKGTFAFAKSENTRSMVTSDEVKVFATEGVMGEISIEEQYTRAFKSDKVQTVELEIKTKGIEFDYAKGQVVTGVLKGQKAYQNKNYDGKIIEATILEVEIPAGSLNETQQGVLTFEGIKLKATKDAVYGDVRVVISGDLNETEQVIVARHGDFATELTVEKGYEVTAGQTKEIEFTLGEVVADSLNGKRETTFTFSEGIQIDALTLAKSEGLQVGAASPVITLVKEDNENTNVFKLASIPADSGVKTALTFKATLRVPASFKGNLTIEAEGRSIEESKQATISKVEVPVEVDVTHLTAKVGYAQQEGGKILITETAPGKLMPGSIFFAFEDDTIEYTQAPDVTVTGGNIKIDPDVKIIDGGLEVIINSKSKEASTIEINGGEFKVNALAAGGTYKVKVGGPAISANSATVLWNTIKGKYNDIDPITDQDFMHLGDQTTSSNKAQFTIGQTSYTVNGVKKQMDTAAYLANEGRTMLPVRYVADALGIPANQIIWDGEEKAVIIMVHVDGALDAVVRIELGSKEMVINNVATQMAARPELKDSRVFIPVAEIARALGAKVQWDPAQKIATFN